ncbi:hypothetical protein [Paraflavitalea sp. CAU 1676]|uniref:hypothetical protein n=1 Tax=Paraflavitalea sp. CAU 1676 TaxID=3032598 RepID=UPI0023DB6073|nr:hypothetical protein [Paraflavitalea sp. CAU 1676]MDF2192587.1 hypothetical protein [Paraflavitalea sp. CAU 1676]
MNKSIQLYIADSIRQDTEVALNSGVMPATNDQAPAGAYYRPGSYIPVNDWVATGYEYRSHFDAGSSTFFNTVGLYSLPDNVIDLIQQLGIEQIGVKDRLLDLFKEKADLVNRLSEQLFPVINRHVVAETELYKLASMLPGLYTTGSRKDEEGYIQFLGLHLDSSKGITLDKAESSKNRLCINITHEPRYLIFLDLSVKDILRMVQEKDPLEKGVSQFTLPDVFFRHYPTYPLVRIKQPAYSYYIAPTDNCVHDGSTMNRTTVDVTLTYLGYFNP